jgi:hypothetical protein
MPDTPTVHFEYDENGARTPVCFENGDTEDLVVTPLGDDLYRLEETSLLGEARYRDVIRARSREDGALLFIRVESPSDLVTQEWLLSQEIIDSPDFGSILERIMAIGGNWERAFGGLLLVHTPENRVREIAEQIKALTGLRT